jgi:hypothetical protein
MFLAVDDGRMSDDNREDMPDLSVRDLKTDMDGRFHDLKTEMNGRFSELKTELNGRFADVDRRFADVDRRFERLDGRITDAAAETRRHFDVIAESLRAEIRLRHEGTDTRLDNHEQRIQALEKRRR